MITSVTEDVLVEVAASVLEDVAFVFVERSPAPPPWSGDVLVAKLAYSGPEDGVLAVTASPALAARFAANMLGVEPDDPEATAGTRDAVGEMVNVIVGSMVARVFGTAELCQLGVPRVVLAPAPDASRSICAVALVTDEGERLDLQILAKDG